MDKKIILDVQLNEKNVETFLQRFNSWIDRQPYGLAYSIEIKKGA